MNLRSVCETCVRDASNRFGSCMSVKPWVQGGLKTLISTSLYRFSKALSPSVYLFLPYRETIAHLKCCRSTLLPLLARNRRDSFLDLDVATADFDTIDV